MDGKTNKVKKINFVYMTLKAIPVAKEVCLYNEIHLNKFYDLHGKLMSSFR